MVGSFGRYTNIQTPVHRFDSRLKFISFIIMVVIIFLDLGMIGYVFKLAAVVGIALAAKVPAKTFISSLKTVLILFITLFIIQWILVKPGNVTGDHVGKLWIGKEGEWYSLYEGAVWKVLDILFKVILMINLTNVLMLTTSPIDLTFAIEDLLSPLKIIKISPHTFAMILSIALRSVPTLIEEAERILKAQASRGADFKNGKFYEKVTTIVSLIIPLFSVSIQRATDLAEAMEIRGYDPHGKRTRYRKFRIRELDIFYFVLVIASLIMCIIFAAQDAYIQIPQDRFMM